MHEPATKVYQTILKSVQGSQSSNLMLLFVPSCQNIGLPKTSIQQMIWKLEMLSRVWKFEMIYFMVVQEPYVSLQMLWQYVWKIARIGEAMSP